MNCLSPPIHDASFARLEIPMDGGDELRFQSNAQEIQSGGRGSLSLPPSHLPHSLQPPHGPLPAGSRYFSHLFKLCFGSLHVAVTCSMTRYETRYRLTVPH